MATLLEQLRSMTTVVADSGDIDSIRKFKPTDSTTNPSLIAAAAEMPAYAPIVDDVLMKARAEAGGNASDKTVATLAFKRSEEHTSEVQSLRHLVCRLLLE